MTRLFKKGILLILLLSLTYIGNAQKIYSFGKYYRGYTGYLTDSLYDDLRRYLGQTSDRKLKDTLFIKYDFNKETCWDRLDEGPEENIKKIIISRQINLSVQEVIRPNISIICYREPGEKINKIKKWDQSIIIDSSAYLKKLFFKNSSLCGSSVIVMPDNRFVVVLSDPHFDAVIFSPAMLELAIEMSSKKKEK